MSDKLPVRLLISDVDGTLVRHDKTLAAATIAAFERLRDAGIQATLISARPPSGIIWLAEALDIDAPLAAFNGGTLFRRDGTILEATHLDPDIARTTIRLLDEAGVDIWLFAEGKWYGRSLDNPHIPRERLSAGVEMTLEAELLSLADRADKIVGVSEDHEYLRVVDDRVKDALGTGATVARSQAYYLDITAVSANKGVGVTVLAAAIGIPLAEVAVIGDMRNDLPMFAKAGLSIAMGQAPETVREAADHVTASNEEDGVAAAIDRVILGAGGSQTA